MLRNTITALACAGVLAASACGGGGNDEEAAAESDKAATEEPSDAAATAEKTGATTFCAGARSLYDELTSSAAGAEPTSPEVQDVFAKAKALEAPTEIAADWTTILDTLIEPVVTGQIDVDDPAGAQALAERAGQVGEALQRTGAYFDTECGFG